MTLQLSDTEAEALRLRAERESRSMQDVARQAVREYVENHSRAELLDVAERTLGDEVPVRDHGLLQSALARPQASAFGSDAYANLEEKVAALLHSLARNHALVDGNERLALAATIAFLGINGRRFTLTSDQAYHLVMEVAAGQLDEVADIAAVIRTSS